MKRAWLAGLLLAGFLAGGCSTPNPPSFQPVPSPGWTTLELRDDIPFEKAWGSAVEIVTRDFDLEFVAHEDGYLRTAWSHTWTGQYRPNYRVRVTVLFPNDHRTVKLKAEAQMMTEEFRWVDGNDERLLPALKAEFLGSIGRTLR